jgi:hypothetical protein
MKPTTIRSLRDQTPFRPFEIHLADGRRLSVVTPDHLMISPTNVEFALYQADGTLDVVDATQITSITRKSRRAAGKN